HRDSGTGVSAENRALTIRALADPAAQPAAFVKPGHTKPLLAKTRGVLQRRGHTEATVDLLRMADLKPVGVLIEICSRRGGGMADQSEFHALSEGVRRAHLSLEAII